METIQCRVCGVQNWLDCGCYYLTGGAGSLGDMNTEFRFIHCPECDGSNMHEPECSGYKEEA